MRAISLTLLSLVVLVAVVLACQILPGKVSRIYAKFIAKLLEDADDGEYVIYSPYPVYFTEDGHIIVIEASGYSVAKVRNIRLMPGGGQGILKIIVKGGEAWIAAD